MPGTTRTTSLFTDPSRGADISPCGRYRYSLWRQWDPATLAVLWVMLNPSTADGTEDDATIRKVCTYARRWGAGGIRVVNLYPWRATNPADLPAGPEVHGEGDGSRNVEAILAAAEDAGRIIAAWGTNPGPLPNAPEHTLRLLEASGPERHRGDPPRLVEALKITKHGQPWHPLYVRGDVVPVPYTGSPMA